MAANNNTQQSLLACSKAKSGAFELVEPNQLLNSVGDGWYHQTASVALWVSILPAITWSAVPGMCCQCAAPRKEGKSHSCCALSGLSTLKQSMELRKHISVTKKGNRAGMHDSIVLKILKKSIDYKVLSNDANTRETRGEDVRQVAMQQEINVQKSLLELQGSTTNYCPYTNSIATRSVQTLISNEFTEGAKVVYEDDWGKPDCQVSGQWGAAAGALGHSRARGSPHPAAGQQGQPEPWPSRTSLGTGMGMRVETGTEMGTGSGCQGPARTMPGGVLDAQQQLPELNDCSTGEDDQVLPILSYFFCPKRLIMEHRMLHPPVKAAHKTEAGAVKAWKFLGVCCQTQQTAQRSSYWKQARQSWREARAERSGASTQLPLAAKQLRIMGNHTSLGTKTVLVTSQLILLINNRTVYDPETWDQTEVKVWDSATRNDKVAVGLLGTWRAVSEALKSPVGPQSETCGLPDLTTYVVADCVTGVTVPLGLIWQLAAAPRSERFSTVDERTLLQNSHRSVCKKYCLVEWKQQVCINARPSASAAAELSGFLMLWRHPRPYKCMQHLVSKGIFPAGDDVLMPFLKAPKTIALCLGKLLAGLEVMNKVTAIFPVGQ
ncbi:hypothetical protein Anapl_14892 [Anas platyrhynchos]|uniref:Uncharacterized protein n=1 Tax=Anas platyrhynchos TaxID=8839 RepID=R0JCA2_ANAPL|nr:hypothetical protein Anapl_14892 [Anas platyrhynchos]